VAAYLHGTCNVINEGWGLYHKVQATIKNSNNQSTLVLDMDMTSSGDIRPAP